MSALTQLVEHNVEEAQRGMRGRGSDARVRKAAKPLPRQIDQPQGLGNTPPATQAHDMQEGIDLTSPNVLNGMYQRYGPAFVHAAVKKHSSKALRKAAAHPDLHPRVATILHAAAAVRKAFQGGNPLPGGPPQYGDTTPNIGIPSRPSHGGPGNPVNVFPSTVPATSRSASTARPNPGAVTHQPQTAGAASQTGTSASNQTVGRQWRFSPSPSNPVNMPANGGVGVGNRGDDDHDDGPDSLVPSKGDLIHFNGPGGSSFTATITQLTTGAAIGEFAGRTVQFPLGSLKPHSVGGADHATNQGTPGGLTASRGGSGVGLGSKNDASEFEPSAGSSNVRKSQRDAIYSGGQGMSASTGAGTELHSPDDGARLTPYSTTPPVNPDAGERDGAAPGNPVNGFLTARERSLIERVVNHRGPIPTETAALKAIDAHQAGERHRSVLQKALKDYSFAVPAAKADTAQIIEKLGHDVVTPPHVLKQLAAEKRRAVGRAVRRHV